MPRNHQIVILGMHRSGTSCVANLLHACGAYYDDEPDRKLNNPQNPKGFWERRDLRVICDHALQASGYDWWAVSGFSYESVPQGIRQRVEDEVRALVASMDAHSPWFIKEPRLCLLAEAFLPALGSAVGLHVWRSPLAVAQSLKKRNGFPVDVGVALWEVYTRAAVVGWRALPAVLQSYESLVADPRQAVPALVEALSAAGVEGLSVPDDDVLAEVIDQQLQRNASEILVADLLSPVQLRLYEALRAGDLSAPAFAEPLSRGAQIRLEEIVSRQAVLLDLQGKAAELARMRISLSLSRKGYKENRNDVVALQDEANALQREVIYLRESLQKARENAVTLGVIKETLERINTNESNTINVLKINKNVENMRKNILSYGFDGGQDRSLRGLLRHNVFKLYYRIVKKTPLFADAARIASSGLFDREYYLSENIDVARKGGDPVLHYLEYGWKEGRDPNPSFQTSFYLVRNPDVWRSGMNPLLHYIMYGADEHRPTCPKKADEKAGKADKSSALEHRTFAPAAFPEAFAHRPRLPLKALKGQRRIVVYTAISGGYDELKVPQILSEHCDFVCFTDQAIPADRGWMLRPFDYINADPTRTARYVKTHPHAYFPDHEWSVWVDANLLLTGDAADFVRKVEGQSLFASFLHGHRTCLYEEAAAVIAAGLDDAQVVERQIAAYRAAGFPEQAGLAETNVLVRRHNEPDVVAVNRMWWKEIDNGSRRDQLSLNYVAHVLNFKLGAVAEAGITSRNDPRVRKFLHGADSSYALPSGQQSIASVADPVPVWEQRDGANLTSPEDLEAHAHLSIDIVVCVHNSLEDVQACLTSVAGALQQNQRIIIVDDGSAEPTKTYCEAFASQTPRTQLIRRAEGSGYTKAANAGLKASSADYVILLNSDTIVSRNWAAKLVQAGESAPDIGIVGPMSNAASWQSIPETVSASGDLAVNDLPPGVTCAHMDQFCELWSQAPLFPRVSLLNGFCFAIKRAVIEAIGDFDEDAFPKGYGEENDYCFRATDAGFALAVATHTYVFHAKSKSYSHDRRKVLAKEGGAAFRARYSADRIHRAVASTKGNPLLERLRKAARAIWSGDGSLAGQGVSAAFLLPARCGGGGVHSVMQECKGLQALGMNVTALVPSIHKAGYEVIYGADSRNLITYYDTPEQLIAAIKPYDAVIATIFQSVLDQQIILTEYPEKLPCYYVQDYEPLFFTGATREKEKRLQSIAEESYSAIPGQVLFAKTEWLQKTVKENIGNSVFKVQPSLDHSVYFPPPPRRSGGPIRIAAMVRFSTPRRSPDLTVGVLQAALAAFGAEIEVHIFGTAPDHEALTASLSAGTVVNHGILRREDVGDLLRGSDVFVDFSQYQAFGRTGLEAMACGCAVIVPAAGGADEYARDGVNALVVDTTDEKNCRQALNRLIEDADLRAALRSEALSTTKRYSVESAAMSELLLLRAAVELRQTDDCRPSVPSA